MECAVLLGRQWCVEDKHTVLLSAAGRETYVLLRNLLASSTHRGMMFDEMFGTSRPSLSCNHWLVIVARFHFHRRNQFVAELR